MDVGLEGHAPPPTCPPFPTVALAPGHIVVHDASPVPATAAECAGRWVAGLLLLPLVVRLIPGPQPWPTLRTQRAGHAWSSQFGFRNPGACAFRRAAPLPG